MFCKNCGKEIKENARFCTGCGVATTPVAQQQDQASQVQQQYQQATAPPQQYQAPPVQQQYQQATAPPQQYQTPPKQNKKYMKPVLGLAGAAAAACVFFIGIFPMIGGDTDLGSMDIEINVENTGGRSAGFDVGECYFTTNDDRIQMIEVNQGLSYGFDSNTGNFYLLDNFVAGKETAIFVALTEPLNPKSEVRLTVEKDGAVVTAMTNVEMIDDQTLLFHPRDISEAGFWDTGTYTFTFEMDDSVAVRQTNFYQSMPMKVLAVPMVNNYSGDNRKCEGDWKFGSTMLTAHYPVARDNVEYVLGPELDLSDPKYDINSDEGQKNVWLALSALQTPGNDYTMIVGFMRTPTVQGYLGYTYGGEATIVCESEPDLIATVVHEIAHCYKIGDEYRRGSLNDILNPPPFGMEGHDILTREPATGTKEKVISAGEYGIIGSGSVIYPEQRAYWLEGRELMGAKASWMGGGDGEDSFNYWITSDISNHLFKVFTGQMTGNEPGYGMPGSGGSTGGEYWGQCFVCFADVYDPVKYINCTTCGEYTPITGESFKCSECGTGYKASDVTEDSLYLYHDACGYVLNYEAFLEHNGESANKEFKEASSEQEDVMILNITGDISSNGTFDPDIWYSYEASPSVLTSARDGEYSAIVYDAKGKQVSITYFDAIDNSQITMKEGTSSIDNDSIPVRLSVKFPEGSTRVDIKKGDKVIYSKDVSKNTPTVKFTGLNEGQDIPNKTTLTWEGSDADGDDITYQIWYVRIDKIMLDLAKEYYEEIGEEWSLDEDFTFLEEEFLVATNVTGTSLDVDLTDYPGTDRGWFRILATDGANTGISESPKVVVPYKAPDILNVDTGVKQVKVTDKIEIQAKIYDAQDGWMWYEGLEWFIDGELFSDYDGNFYVWQDPYHLAPGMHTFTCKVTNSGGLSASRDFLYEVIEDESDLPDDWSRNDISVALRLGFYLPLDRLESPVTRIEFAKLMFTLGSLPFPEKSGHIPGVERLIDFTDMSNDLNDMDYNYAMYMVGVGVMDAPDDAFNPHGSLTEREAMQIFYKTLEMFRTETTMTYEVMDESEFIPELTEWGLFDESDGPNEYQAGEKITKKVLMSRIARFIRNEFGLDDKFYGWGTVKSDESYEG